MPIAIAPPQPLLHALPGGARLLVMPLPQATTVTVAVFVHSGSEHESARQSGISHAIEHMVFKGTATRDARRINLDAERLGAEVNAHTDKDHTAYYMRGLPAHTGTLVAMLAELVQAPTFPEDELERERAVLLHEFTEDEDDPLSSTFKLFDKGCWGAHALAQPVIGSRRNLERFTRSELVDWVRQHYTAGRTVVGVAGPIDPDALLATVDAAFGSLPPGTAPLLATPAWRGGVHSRILGGSSQSHLVLGFPIADRRHDDPTATLAAAVLGEGMSSPLLARLREERGLAYYAACSADVQDIAGQFVIELSTSPAQLLPALHELAQLLAVHAERVDAVDLERARNQLAVRHLRSQERPLRRLEDAALEVFAGGQVRAPQERLARLAAVDANTLRAEFERMLAAGATLALAGKLPRAASARAREAVPQLLRS
ncbi:MAG: insulinase family protein [Rubrivivax sp.]|nr:insulinase family protein [Rubrivivax sp.]